MNVSPHVTSSLTTSPTCKRRRAPAGVRAVLSAGTEAGLESVTTPLLRSTVGGHGPVVSPGEGRGGGYPRGDRRRRGARAARPRLSHAVAGRRPAGHPALAGGVRFPRSRPRARA